MCKAIKAEIGSSMSGWSWSWTQQEEHLQLRVCCRYLQKICEKIWAISDIHRTWCVLTCLNITEHLQCMQQSVLGWGLKNSLYWPVVFCTLENSGEKYGSGLFQVWSVSSTFPSQAAPNLPVSWCNLVEIQLSIKISIWIAVFTSG